MSLPFVRLNYRGEQRVGAGEDLRRQFLVRARAICSKENVSAISHYNLQTHHLKADGVHLKPEGTAILQQNILSAIIQLIQLG